MTDSAAHGLVHARSDARHLVVTDGGSKPRAAHGTSMVTDVGSKPRATHGTFTVTDCMWLNAFHACGRVGKSRARSAARGKEGSCDAPLDPRRRCTDALSGFSASAEATPSAFGALRRAASEPNRASRATAADTVPIAHSVERRGSQAHAVDLMEAYRSRWEPGDHAGRPEACIECAAWWPQGIRPAGRYARSRPRLSAHRSL